MPAVVLMLALSVAIAPTTVGFGGVSFEGDKTGVVNENTETVPPGCDEVEGSETVTVRVLSSGSGYPLYEYEPKTVEVGACTELELTLFNENRVRHQYVVRGLPEETYPGGYFGIETEGKAVQSGSLITPADSTTLPVESTVSGQAGAGLRGQIKVAGGDGDTPGVPGVTSHGWEGSGDTETPFGSFLFGLGGFLLGILTAFSFSRWG